jgi:hypothetical protein
MHLNSKKNKIVVTSSKEGLTLYKITAENQIERVGNLIHKRIMRKEQNILDAQWSQPLQLNKMT